MDFNINKLIQKLIHLQTQMNEIDITLKNLRTETHNTLWDLVEKNNRRNNKNFTVGR
jgi:hypothetical protein